MRKLSYINVYIEANAKDLEKLNILQQKIAECTQKITELGTLQNQEIYNKFNNMSTKQFFKEMAKANNHLKKNTGKYIFFYL